MPRQVLIDCRMRRHMFLIFHMFVRCVVDLSFFEHVFRLGACLRACGFNVNCVDLCMLLVVAGSLLLLRLFCDFVWGASSFGTLLIQFVLFAWFAFA